MTTAEMITLIVSISTALGVTILTIWSTRQDKARDQLNARLDSNDLTTRTQGSRITTLEEHIKHLPTAESIGRLHEKVNEVSIQVGSIKGGQEVLTDLLSRLLGNGGVKSKAPPNRR